MSRMTLLDSNVWLSLAAPRALGAGKAGDAGYPPYNIELLPEGAGGHQALRVTLAVAGSSEPSDTTSASRASPHTHAPSLA